MIRTLATTLFVSLCPSPIAPQGIVSSAGRPCAFSIDDTSGAGCLTASSVPTLGKLFPLSPDFFIDPAGRVGIGTTSPLARLHVEESDPSGIALEVLCDTLLHGSFVRNGGGGLGQTAIANDFGSGLVGSAHALLTFLFVRGAGVSATSYSEEVDGLNRPGLFASAESWLRDDDGVVGRTDSQGVGIGVNGLHSSPLGTGAGVQGWTLSNADAANGVLGLVSSTTPGSFSSAVRGVNSGTAGTGIGVWGSQDGTGWGVYGTVSGAGRGVYGVGGSGGTGVYGQAQGAGYGVFSFGDSGATGTKSFVQPHPEDPGREVRFVCLEGNESGTYFRGSSRTVGGQARIEVPEAFRLVTDPEGLTVQLTPRGPGFLWVEAVSLHEVVVRGQVDMDFDYFVNGVRMGYRDFEPVRTNTTFVPTERGVPFGAELAPEVRALLVETGVLNADFTPNEATALRMGWGLSDPVDHAAARKRIRDHVEPVVERGAALPR